MGIPEPSSVQQEHEGRLQRSFPEERDPEKRPFTDEIAFRFFSAWEGQRSFREFLRENGLILSITRGGNSRLAEKLCMMRGVFLIRLRPTFSGFLR